MKVHNTIKKLREERGIAQKDAAAALGVSRQTMTAIENMKYNPSLELTLKIAKFFSLPVEEIFTLVEEEKKMNNSLIILGAIYLFVLLFLSCFSIYGIGSLLVSTCNILGNDYDELERKAIFDSFAYSMLILLMIHFMQMIFSIRFKGTYIPIITSGVPHGMLIGGSHFESFLFDTSIISLIYTFIKIHFGLLSKKKAFLIVLVISILSFISVAMAFYYSN